MDDRALSAISAWLVEGGLAGREASDLVQGFCLRCAEAGLDLSRALVIVDTLHPSFEGRAFRWRGDGVDESQVVEYPRSSEGTGADEWRRSVFFHLLGQGLSEWRCRLAESEPLDFSQVETLRVEGHTDFAAFIHRFSAEGSFGDMDCVYSNWATRRSEGFSEADVDALRRLLPTLALAVKSTTLAGIARTLTEVYLGRGAGERVLAGRIQRGVAERLEAVLWFSDLRGYTAISDSSEPDEIIPLLNDYADAAITSIDEQGGDVLKLIGDGILAIFEASDPGEACNHALRAKASMDLRVARLNEKRLASNRPVTSVYLGLHIGEVYFGNVGSEKRLDFTVVGPAVNEVSRIASLCRAVDRDLLLSERFARHVPETHREQLASVGRYALRGIRTPQELFTLECTA